jgi:TBC1 domain family protein 5
MSQIKIKKKSLDECIFVFKTLFTNENFIKDIFSSSKEGKLNIILRPISYRIFLNIFDAKSKKNWVEVVSSQREEYKNKFKKYCKIKKFSGDPLAGGNIKNDEDKELKDLINKDLIRTYQDIDIFLKNNIKNYLANILYIWSKENKSISYRQGMNEILAGLLLAFYPVYFVSKSKPKPNKNEIMNILNQFEGNSDINYEDLYVFFHDEDEIQSDLYYTFDAIMKRGQQLLFNPKPLEKNDKNYNLYELFPNQKKIRIDDDLPTFINKRCAYLIYEKLQGIDEDLYEHFIKIDLPCTVFLQKWLRCLFNREYEYNDVLYLWDSIFAHEYIDKKTEKYSFIFVDYVALAMLIKIRDMLKDKDQNDCLSI